MRQFRFQASLGLRRQIDAASIDDGIIMSATDSNAVESRQTTRFLRERLPGTPAPRKLWIGAEGLVIAGDCWGDPHRQHIYLLHGGGQTRHSWKDTGERLGDLGYFAVSYDARGHGDSDRAAGRSHYTTDLMIDDLVAVARALDDGPPVLIGASMGGICSMIAVGERRIEASALVLVDIAPVIETAGRDEVHSFLAAGLKGFGSLDEVAAAIANYQPHRKRQRRLDSLAKNVRRGEDGRYYWHWDSEWYRSLLERPDLLPRRIKAAQTIDVPTLLVRGRMSNVLSKAGARAFLNQCPQADYVDIQNAAHMVTGDNNDVFFEAISAFLARLLPRR